MLRKFQCFKKKHFYAFFYFVVLVFLLSKAYHSSNDFHTYYRASLRLLSGNFNIYTLADGQGPFWYPPFFAYVFSFWSVFPRNIAQLIWGMINVLFLLGIAFEFKKIFKIHKWSSDFYFILTILMLYPIMSSFRSGNIHTMLLYFLLLVLRFSKEKKEFQAGFFLAMIVLFKVTPIILIPYFIFKMNWKLLLFFIISLLSLILFPSVIIGFDLNISLYTSFLGFLKNYDSVVNITRETIQSIDSASIRLFTSAKGVNIIDIPRSQAVLLAKIISAIILLPSAFLFIKNYKNKFPYKLETEYAIMLSALVLLTPSAFIHTMMIFSLSTALIINYFLSGSKNQILLIMALTSFLLITFSSEIFLGNDLKNIVTLHSVPTLGAVLLFYSINYLYKILAVRGEKG